MRYILYARKSSESEDKQAQSIDDQLTELRAVAKQRGLSVVLELTEARSAKDPGGRPIFAEMVQRIQDGEADAILCWHVNRLFRNPVDFGTVSWMLQTGLLKEILTPTQAHRTGDNVLLLSVENGMANQYILDLRKSVLRGLRSKVDKGWFPHKAPAGYLNHDSEIIKDPLRFDQLRRLWDIAITGQHSIPQIVAKAKELGFTTRQTKRRGGDPLNRSTLYAMFNNLFYAGYFVRAGETHKGAHTPMVTLNEFFTVQKHLKRQGRRQVKRDFAFNGLIRCGQCGGAICGERKEVKLLGGKTNVHYYYSCTNGRKTCVRKVVSEEAIERQISKVLEKLKVPFEFIAFAQQVIMRWKDEALASHEAIQRQNAEALAVMERKQSKLLEMRMKDLLSDAEYIKEKDRLGQEIISTRMTQDLGTQTTAALWENIENTVTLLHYGQAYFDGGNPAMQHLIADILGAHYILTDRSLAIELSPAFGEVARIIEAHGGEMGKENTNRAGNAPYSSTDRMGQAIFGSDGEYEKGAKSGSGSKQNDPFGKDRLVWWGILDATRMAIQATGAIIPNLVMHYNATKIAK